jgi:hypothetical protein
MAAGGSRPRTPEPSGRWLPRVRSLPWPVAGATALPALARLPSLSPMEEDPTTREHRIQQIRREEDEREEAEEAPTEEAAEQHARRADKAAYLREKLEERARSERER